MVKVIVIQQVYKSRKWVPRVYDALMAQTYQDVEIVAQIVDDEGDSKDYILDHYPTVKIVEPGYNIGFAKGHNELFTSLDADLFQLVNPDLILEPTYIEEMVKVFADLRVGAATGKLLKYNFDLHQKTNLIDSTGVIVYKTGRARDRGQHEEDLGQCDSQTNVLAVSGAGPMFRKFALEAVKMSRAEGGFEFFDQDFHSYWEDVDLGWRIVNAGLKCVFVPGAVAYHGRLAGARKGGYLNVADYRKHHAKIPARIRRLNYKNHIFLFIKNSPKLYWKFFAREFFMLGYILVFETSTLGVLPEFFKQLPKMWQKRKWIQKNRKVSVEELEKLFVDHPTDLFRKTKK